MSIRSFLAGLTSGAEKLEQGAQRLNEAAGRMAQRSEAFRFRTEGMLTDTPWFTDFEGSVKGCLMLAREEASREEELDVTPGMREIYAQVSLEFGEPSPLEQQPEPEWVRQGAPMEPINLPKDLEAAKHYREGFQAALHNHAAFVQQVNEELRKRPAMREPFRKYMIRCGLQKVLDDQFHSL